MKPLDLRIAEWPKLNRPILLCGLPDAGLVAKLAVDQVVRELSPTLFAEIFSHWFPASVVVESSGISRLIRNELYYWKSSSGQRDLIIYTGETQPTEPSGAYAVADQVLDLAKALGADEVVILAAFIKGEAVQEPKVYGAATDPDTASAYKAKGLAMSEEGAINWIHGVLLGLATIKGMRGICLSAETPGNYADPKAAHAVLKAAQEFWSIPLTLKGLEEQAAMVKKMGYQRPGEEEEEKEERGRLGYIG